MQISEGRLWLGTHIHLETSLNKRMKQKENLRYFRRGYKRETYHIPHIRSQRRKWKQVVEREEQSQKQRSMILWISKGDMNTNFFHRLASKHKKINSIRKLIDNNIIEIIDEKEIGRQTTSYFKETYNPLQLQIDPMIENDLLGIINLVVHEGKTQYFIKKKVYRRGQRGNFFLQKVSRPLAYMGSP